MTRTAITLALAAAPAALLAANNAHAQTTTDRSFTGPRVELNAGYDTTSADALPNGNDTLDGARVGVAVGYDVQLGKRVVAGVEAGIGFDLGEQKSVTLVGTPATERYRVDTGRDIDVSARLGFLAGPRTLIYAKAGWANSGYRARVTRTVGNTVTRIAEESNENGLRVGAGVEHMFGERIYGKAEYRYTSYGQGVDRHQALLGVGVRF